MNKKALFNFITDGVNYEKGKIYKAEDVAHIDPTNFEDTEAEANAVAGVPSEEVPGDEVRERGEAPRGTGDTSTATDEGAEGEKKDGVVINHQDDNKGAGLDDHKVITQEDLDTNPDYVALGLQVGDPIPADENVLE